jgi:hypothetical protein
MKSGDQVNVSRKQSFIRRRFILAFGINPLNNSGGQSFEVCPPGRLIRN